ncbi:MAG: DUF4276 family protein [Planctomycetaceae bacterium]|nr:DUF4276 family protein [Planctomycetaceae bacterium]
MKVLICCEGAHEKSGALQTLIEKLLGRAIDAEYDPPTRLVQQAGKGGKLFKKALGYALAAERRGCDGVVFLVDHDDGPDGNDRVKQLTRAQEHLALAATVKRAFGVPVVTFDAWMIADEVAMSKALGMTVDRSPDPEEIADAKSFARAIVGERKALREFYREVAAHADPKVLQDRCPKGFRPFAERLSRWLA